MGRDAKQRIEAVSAAKLTPVGDGALLRDYKEAQSAVAISTAAYELCRRAVCRLKHAPHKPTRFSHARHSTASTALGQAGLHPAHRSGSAVPSAPTWHGCS